jgi:hypothetical protein
MTTKLVTGDATKFEQNVFAIGTNTDVRVCGVKRHGLIPIKSGSGPFRTRDWALCNSVAKLPSNNYAAAATFTVPRNSRMSDITWSKCSLRKKWLEFG